VRYFTKSTILARNLYGSAKMQLRSQVGYDILSQVCVLIIPDCNGD